ncbi:unnamed protein product [Nesidiocoris tenuis]|uniref:Uncharacterized protein n=1 Tax=Nesidiocoris tenuis TaxID=355587 RepID=A0A6H5H4F9_9HEMI|nr:unnamed protein product [Nesidiocoris tenuis]
MLIGVRTLSTSTLSPAARDPFTTVPRAVQNIITLQGKIPNGHHDAHVKLKTSIRTNASRRRKIVPLYRQISSSTTADPGTPQKQRPACVIPSIPNVVIGPRARETTGLNKYQQHWLNCTLDPVLSGHVRARLCFMPSPTYLLPLDDQTQSWDGLARLLRPMVGVRATGIPCHIRNFQMRFSQFNTCVEWSTLAINASIMGEAGSLNLNAHQSIQAYLRDISAGSTTSLAILKPSIDVAQRVNMISLTFGRCRVESVRECEAAVDPARLLFQDWSNNNIDFDDGAKSCWDVCTTTGNSNTSFFTESMGPVIISE